MAIPKNTVNVDETEDVILEAEGLDEDVELTDGEETDTEDEGEDVDAEQTEEDTQEEETTSEQPEDKTPDPNKPLFNDVQQQEVNKLIQARLVRQETKFVSDLARAAGVDLTAQEIPQAAKLWGMLKHNPALSAEVDKVITTALSKGYAKEPVALTNATSEAEARLAFKEAVLDMKASNTTFNKNSDKILAWAEAKGYEVTDAKSLELAYLAWQGTQSKVTETARKASAQRKQDAKTQLKKRATVQKAKTGKAAAPSNYRKMTDAAILASEGLNLFTEE